MAREPEWQREVRDARRVESFSLSAPNRLVKAVPLAWSPMSRAKGYVTVERYLLGRTPRQLENDLGLPSGCYSTGCRVYRMTRLPGTSEISYELTAEHPGGLAFDEWAAMDEVLRRRQDPSYTPKPIYGPGRSAIHQWELTSELPVAIVVDLLPTSAYPYPG